MILCYEWQKQAQHPQKEPKRKTIETDSHTSPFQYVSWICRPEAGKLMVDLENLDKIPQLQKLTRKPVNYLTGLCHSRSKQ